MKCALVLVSLVVFTYAGPITFGTGKHVTIDDDGTITVVSGTGKKIILTKAIGHPGPKDIEITVDGPHGSVKKIEIDGETNTKTVNLLDDMENEKFAEEERDKRSSKDIKESKYSKEKYQKPQSEILSQIFKEYQGVVDAKSYNTILAKINNAVQMGELNPAVYNVMQSLDRYRLAEKYGSQVPSVMKGYPSGYQYQISEQYGNQVPFVTRGYPSGYQYQTPEQYGNQVPFVTRGYPSGYQYQTPEQKGWEYPEQAQELQQLQLQKQQQQFGFYPRVSQWRPVVEPFANY